MASVFLNIIRPHSTQALKIVEENNIEYLLSEKQLLLWNWIVKQSTEFSRKDSVMNCNQGFTNPLNQTLRNNKYHKASIFFSDKVHYILFLA